jgi:hypothetical protein
VLYCFDLLVGSSSDRDNHLFPRTSLWKPTIFIKVYINDWLIARFPINRYRSTRRPEKRMNKRSVRNQWINQSTNIMQKQWISAQLVAYLHGGVVAQYSRVFFDHDLIEFDLLLFGSTFFRSYTPFDGSINNRSCHLRMAWQVRLVSSTLAAAIRCSYVGEEDGIRLALRTVRPVRQKRRLLRRRIPTFGTFLRRLLEAVFRRIPCRLKLRTPPQKWQMTLLVEPDCSRIPGGRRSMVTILSNFRTAIVL